MMNGALPTARFGSSGVMVEWIIIKHEILQTDKEKIAMVVSRPARIAPSGPGMARNSS